jgi:hypothetical protein
MGTRLFGHVFLHRLKKEVYSHMKRPAEVKKNEEGLKEGALAKNVG